MTAIAKIIQDDERCPKNLQIDMEKEFYNTNVQKLLKKHDINHYSTYFIMKASVVEGFNCTLKNDMLKQFTHNKNYKWIDCYRISSLSTMRKYQTISMRPIDVISIIADKLLNTMYSNQAVALPRFKEDDLVSKFKAIFEKGYTSNWTTEVFRIVKVQKTNNDISTERLSWKRRIPVAGMILYELHCITNPDVYLIEKVT